MTPRFQNADCRVHAPRWSVGGGRGVPTWPLTLETLWCQKSDAGRGGNPDRRLNREAARMLQRPRGQDSPRAPWVQVLFSWRGGPGPGEPHKLVQVWFNSRPRSHFGASASPAFSQQSTHGTVGAANSPMGQSPNGPVPPEHKSKPAFATWVSGTLSSTPSVSYGGFTPGLSARVVVWFIGVEVDSSDRFQFARRFTPVSGHYFDRECVYAGRRAFLSVVVPAGPFGGVRDVTTDAPGVGPSTDAGRLLFRGPLGERPGKSTR